MFKLQIIGIIVLFFIKTINCNLFDVKITRIQQNYDIDINEIVQIDSIKECPKIFQKYNKSLITQECFQKDLIFQVGILLGNSSKSNQFQEYNMTLDLHSPWTYFVANDCTQCSLMKKLPIYINNFSKLIQSYKNCDDSCISEEQISDQKFQYDSDKLQSKLIKLNKHAFIQSKGIQMLGQFYYDSLMLIVHDENIQLSFKQFIKKKLDQKDYKYQKEILYMKKIKMFGISYIIGDNIISGGLGLGYIDQQNDDENIVEDTNFIQIITNIYDSSPLFSIYLGMINNETPDFILTIGGANPKYSIKDFKYFNLNDNKGPHWSLIIKQFRIYLPDSQLTYKTIQFDDKTQALISTSASYIALPIKQIQLLLDILNQIDGAKCYVIDKQYMQVYCENMKKYHVLQLLYDINFEQQTTDNIDSYGLFKKCENQNNFFKDYDSISSLIDQNELFNCILNIRVSTENKVILGEPFIRQHYIIFDQENNRIGLAPVIKTYLEDIYNKSWINYIINWLIAIFILGMITICCYRNFVKLYKKIKNLWNNRNFKTDVIEIQNLNDSHIQSHETFANDQEQSKEEYQEELKNEILQLQQLYQIQDESQKNNIQSEEQNKIIQEQINNQN